MSTTTKTFTVFTLSVLYIYSVSGIAIEPEYPTYYILEPRSLELTCTNVGGNSLEWYKGSSKLTSPEYTIVKNVSMTPTGNNVVTVVKAATSPSDSGVYTCQTDNATEVAKSINVQVVKVTTTNAEFSPGQVSAFLVCSLDEVDTAVYNRSWEFGDVTLQNDDRFAIIKENSSLIIRNPRSSDGGEYVCVNDFKTQIIKIPVNFYVPPTVQKPNQSVSVTVGNPVSLQCAIYSYPQPTISWLKNGTSVTDMDRVTVLNDGGQQNGLLTINPTKLEDKGTYTCVIYSQYFNMTAVGHFNVYVTKTIEYHASGADVTSVCYVLMLSTFLVILTSLFCE